jgi:thioredoxin
MRKISVILLAGGFFITIQGCNSQSESASKKGSDLSGVSQNQPANLSLNENTLSAENVINTPVKITKADFLEKIMDYEKNSQEWIYKGNLPSLIDFYADWCAPCMQTAPILDELAKEYAGKVIIYKVDIQKERELASVFGIQSIPAFLFIPVEGNPSMSSGIAGSREETKKMFVQQIENILLKTATQGSSSL